MRESLDRGTAEYPFRVTAETNPPQPAEIAQAIAALLVQGTEAPDAWWQAGIEESLERESDGRAAAP